MLSTRFFNDFDRFFEDPFFTSPLSVVPRPFAHALELYPEVHWAGRTTTEGIEVELEVPRYKQEDIKVDADVEKGVVTVTGSRGKRVRGQEGSDSVSSGTTVSSFKKSFAVPTAVYDLSKLTSELSHGVLTIKVPRKPEQAKIEQRSAAKESPVQIERASAPAAPTSDGTVSAQAKPTDLHWPPRMQLVSQPAGDLAAQYELVLPSADIPPENVHLSVLEDGSGLKVHVNHSIRREHKHGFEESSGSYERVVSLPAKTKPSDVSARIENGKLTISVKKAQ